MLRKIYQQLRTLPFRRSETLAPSVAFCIASTPALRISRLSQTQNQLGLTKTPQRLKPNPFGILCWRPPSPRLRKDSTETPRAQNQSLEKTPQDFEKICFDTLQTTRFIFVEAIKNQGGGKGGQSRHKNKRRNTSSNI